MKDMIILISGGTGLIGSRLVDLLKRQGHQVRILSRNPTTDRGFLTYEWNIAEGKLDMEALDAG